MNNFSLLQINELRFKYMGSYPSDKKPQLTKYSFANVNSAKSNDKEEHWIIIAQMDKFSSLLILWVEKEQLIPF